MLDGATPKYVGWTRDVSARVDQHWKKRRDKKRRRENPQLCEWLSSMLFPPAVQVLDTVPWASRYRAERRWTVALRQKYPLVNIADGAAPLRRGPLTAEHKAAISAGLARRRARALSPAAAA